MKEMMKKWAALYVQKITEHKGKERLYWIAAGPVIVLGVFTCACILLGLVWGILVGIGSVVIRFPAFASDLDGPVLALILCLVCRKKLKRHFLFFRKLFDFIKKLWKDTSEAADEA